MIFDIFRTKKVDDFAMTLAHELAKRFPPEMENEIEKKVTPKRISKILEDVFVKATDFKNKNKLGMYKKARLGNTFKWELQDLGYSEKFVELATEGLIVYITKKNEK